MSVEMHAICRGRASKERKGSLISSGERGVLLHCQAESLNGAPPGKYGACLTSGCVQYRDVTY
jgi:hypothetical protein